MKKKIIKRIGVFLCALVVLFGSLCVEPYFADFSKLSAEEWFYSTKLQELKYDGEVSLQLPSIINDYNYYSVWYSCITGNFVLCCSDKPSYVYSIDGASAFLGMAYSFSPWTAVASLDGVNWSDDLETTLYSYMAVYSSVGNDVYERTQDNVRFVTSNHDIVGKNSGLIFFKAGEIAGSGGFFDAELGYLKNVSYDIAYEMGALYNYDESSRTDRFQFDKLTTTGLDLSSGNYSINHYIRPVLCTGYEDEDIVEKGERYLMGTYDASGGEFRYKRVDYEEKLKEYGYDGVGFFDTLLGRFYLEWHYLQIVNNDTGEVGNYVVMRPKDADKNEFGTELIAYTVDEDDEKDTENGYDETIVDHSNTGAETIDDAFEKGDNEEAFENLDGIDEFTKALKSFTKSIGSVTDAFGKLLGAMPQWVVNVLGISIALAVLTFVIKVLRG